MAKKHSKSPARSRKGKGNKTNKQNKKSKQDPAAGAHVTPLLQRDSNDRWLLSEEMMQGYYPTHNQYIGLTCADTLHNVCAGIQTLTAVLCVPNHTGIASRNHEHHGVYWLAINLLDALSFEVHHRDKLILKSSE